MSERDTKGPLKFKSLDELKPLYNDLNLNGKHPRTLMQMVDRLYNLAKEKMNSGDLEYCYIFLMRYLNVVSYIQKTEEFKADPKYYKGMLGRKPVEALEIAEKLHITLKKSYELLYPNENVPKEKPGAKKADLNQEALDMRVMKESKSMITCAKLFTMIKDNSVTVLIIDARSAADFESSRIMEGMVNIPGDIITRGKSANVLEQELSDSSKKLFKDRGTYDHVVLLDWSPHDENSKDSKLAILKEILTEWDINTKYKNEILILDGGYEDWLDKYPWHTTNPKPVRPTTGEAVSDGVLDQVEYPDLDDEIDKEAEPVLKPFFDRSKKPLKRPSKELDQEGNEVQVGQAGPPAFDRAKKAAAIKTYEERKADVANLLDQKEQGILEAIALQKILLQNEKDLNESIQKNAAEEDELAILLKLEELKEEAKAKEELIQDLQKIIEVYEKRDLEEMAKKQADEERIAKEAKVNERIKEQQEEKNKLTLEREELEMIEHLRKKYLEERYKERIEMARARKKEFLDNSFRGQLQYLPPEVHENLPVVNRQTKPRTVEKVRQFSGVRGRVGRGLTGLRNLGNTCYMNTILQCISNNTALVKYFCENHYRGDLQRKNRTKGEVAEEIAALIKTLWSGQFISISCQDFKNTVGNYKAEYANTKQQDSHEFLTFLMDWLHNDLNKVSDESLEETDNNLNDMEKAWFEFKQKNESLISTLFYGLQKSTLTCLQCDEASVTYEPFSNLSLIIPDEKDSTADRCMRFYLKSERISGWRCPRCNEPREADKKTDICKLPPILIIQLKRFEFTDEAMKSVKRTGHVTFPLTNWNMSQYVTNINQKYANYNLYAVSNHYGTMEGGHYTAYCKSPLYKKWYNFDDHEVNEIASSAVDTNAAYILFYTSINYQVPS